MLSNILDTGVLIIAGVALTITLFSIYVSRVYLPMKIKVAYLKSITALAAAVETKDSGTVGHAQRVAQLTVELARNLGLKEPDLGRVEYAALLMDIGKANVPQVILNKLEPLSIDEWEIIKSHSQLGAEMVASVPFLASISDYVRHHHEYWDGSGYPDAIKGEEIPLVSRILSIAADFDAMISKRPYHDALSPEEAIEEVRRGIGSKYDPNVARIFLEMIENGFSIAEVKAA